MLNKYKKLVVITYIIFILFIPIIEIVFYNNSTPNAEIFSEINNIPNSQAFSIEDFNPIIEDQIHGLGTVKITNLTFNGEGLFNYTNNYPDLDDDLTSGALNVSYNYTKYIETIDFAQSDNLNESLVYSNIITVLLNESIDIYYNTTIGNSEGFLIYKTILARSNLDRFLIQNESSSLVEELNEEDYSIDDSGFVVFNYDNYFNEISHSFTIYFIWEYQIILNDWNIYQNNEVIITKQEQEISPEFTYNFTVLGYKYNLSSIKDEEIAENLEIDILVNPLDKDELYDHNLEINDVPVTNFLDVNLSINATMSMIPGFFSMNFTANYTIRFEDPLVYSWTIDRLVENKNIRERIYVPTLVSGPDHIYLSQLVIYESSITIDQVVSNSSLFDRNVLNYDANLSVLEEYYQHSLIFTENAIKKKGLKIILPYLIDGETNPFFIKYDANNDILIIVTDNINMPIANLDIEIYYYNKPYGTYISNDLIQPSAPLSTDVNGEALIENLPTGNYTLKIFRKNILLKEVNVSTFNNIYYISTGILHFPILIIIFGSISGLILLIGLMLYFNSKKNSN